MEYKRAEDILPKELLEEIQSYIQGATLYIPKEPRNMNKWGSRSGLKSELAQRNNEIKRLFKTGYSIKNLVNDYYLSEETIKKIVYKK